MKKNTKQKNKNIKDPDKILALTANNEKVIPVHKNCMVCQSGHVDEIHRLRPYYTLDELSEVIFKKYKIHLNKSVLSYHFNRYYRTLSDVSTRKLYEQFNADVDAIADHRKKILFLASVGFENLLKQIDEGRLFFGIKEFTELIKVYHNVLADPSSGNNANLLAIFQKATDKFGVNLNQGILFSTKKKPDDE